MQYQPKVVFKPEHDSFSDPAQVDDGLAADRVQGRQRGAEEKGTEEPYPLQALPKNARVQSLDIESDIG